MNKQDRNRERITRIKNERKEMLKLVKNEIRNNNKDLLTEIKNILKVLDFDDKNIKKYEELNKAKELISNLIKEITVSKTPEEITEIRKKLNYYINKIKKEMIKRNLEEEKVTKYNEDIKELRNNVSKYVRFLKRENNIKELTNLNKKYNKLSKEELQKMKKMMSLEQRYNTNYKNKEKNISEEKKDIKEIKDYGIKIKYISSDSIETIKYNPIEYISDRVKIYDSQYGIQTLDEYGDSKVKNLKVFFKNIKKNINNKSKIKIMKHDSNHYYSGEDLIGYMEYMKENNSILKGLKRIFRKTSLFSKRMDYLTNHEKCVYWIMDYCNNNSLNYVCR